VWWPLPLLAVGGVLCGLAVKYLPGTGGHSPADGFKTTGPLPPIQLPGVLLAAMATLVFGVVLGPEAPLIALGSGLGVLAVQLAARDAPPTAAAVMSATGSFAAISSLLGSPLVGAFLLLEASGLGGPMLGLVLVPGLLAAGIGTLIFLGLDSISGLGTFTLAVHGLPAFDHLTVADFGYALAIGLVAPFLGRGITLLAIAVRTRVEPRMVLLMPVLGLLIGGLAIGFGEATDKPASDVLFSGQSALPDLISNASEWSVGALLLVILCKGLAYALSLSSFRGGPVFPSLYVGAAVGIAASHLPGLDVIPAAAMGIGAMCAVMLSLPLTATLLAALLMGSDGIQVMPVVIVAVVVAYVVTARITPPPADEDQRRERPAKAPTTTPMTVTK
jgi:H+/Cl- antiporter ClcA